MCTGALIAGCSTASGSLPPAEHGAHVAGPQQALAELSEAGPERFAMVTPELFRGGQPDEHDLELLRALGVTTIIDLRRERLGVRRAESAAARRLGMHFVEYPYYGVFGADVGFIHGVVSEMSSPHGGAVYIHCGDGGERTSLMVALYRVLEQGWNPAEAWEREVVDYGHHRSPVFREIELTYRELVHDHELEVQTAQRSAASRRAIAATRAAGPAGAPDHDVEAVAAGGEPAIPSAHQEPRADDRTRESGSRFGRAAP